jgi:hypothetical protein
LRTVNVSDTWRSADLSATIVIKSLKQSAMLLTRVGDANERAREKLGLLRFCLANSRA